MNESSASDEMEVTGKEGSRTREVVLRLLLEVISKYECGATELSGEFDIAEITPELLMHVCLAAPEVDDLMLGFIRDDLKVVSLSDQTRSMVDRDIGLLDRDPSRWLGVGNGALGQQLSVRSRAEADVRVAQGRSSELERFIVENPDVFESVRELRHPDLVRWVMLSLMRETKARKRGSGVIATWREKLAPELKKRVEAIQTRYGTAETQPMRASLLRHGNVKAAPRLGL